MAYTMEDYEVAIQPVKRELFTQLLSVPQAVAAAAASGSWQEASDGPGLAAGGLGGTEQALQGQQQQRQQQQGQLKILEVGVGTGEHMVCHCYTS